MTLAVWWLSTTTKRPPPPSPTSPSAPATRTSALAIVYFPTPGNPMRCTIAGAAATVAERTGSISGASAESPPPNAPRVHQRCHRRHRRHRPPARAPHSPAARPSRAVVEVVGPLVDGGAFPAKATVGEPVTVTADVFSDGHDRAAAALRYRSGPRRRWSEVPMEALGNDRFAATFVPERLGPWQFQVVGWLDHLGTWLHGMELKLAAPPEMNVDVTVDLQIGSLLVTEALARAKGTDARALTDLRARLDDGDTRALGHLPDDDAAPHHDGHVPDLQDVEPEHGAAEALEPLFWRTGPRDPLAAVTDVRRPRRPGAGAVQLRGTSSSPARPSHRRPVTPRWSTPSTASTTSRRWASTSSTCRRSTRSGVTNRKGRNNTVTPSPDDVGSPWAIGAAEGGHTAVHPELGTVDDVAALRRGSASSAASSWPSTSPSSARPTTRGSPSTRSGSATGPTARSSTPRTRRRSTRTSTRSTSRAPTGGACGTALADVFRFWIDARRHGLPRRQPAHQAVRRSGSG